MDFVCCYFSTFVPKLVHYFSMLDLLLQDIVLLLYNFSCFTVIVHFVLSCLSSTVIYVSEVHRDLKLKSPCQISDLEVKVMD